MPRKFLRNSREIGRFLREFVPSNPAKFHFFSRELSEALYKVLQNQNQNQSDHNSQSEQRLTSPIMQTAFSTEKCKWLSCDWF